MSAKKKPTIVGALTKTRDELSATGGTAWFSLMTNNSRNTDKNIKAGGPEWIPDPTRPMKVLIVINRVKTWLTAVDLKVLENLLNDNRADLDTSYLLAGIREVEKADAMKKLFQE